MYHLYLRIMPWIHTGGMKVKILTFLLWLLQPQEEESVGTYWTGC